MRQKRWLIASLAEAAARLKGEQRVVMRRLTRDQYTNALQDLLSLPIEFGQPALHCFTILQRHDCRIRQQRRELERQLDHYRAGGNGHPTDDRDASVGH